MSLRPAHAPTPAAALATLGMVAALVCLLAERVLPRIAQGGMGRDVRVAFALLEVQHAMLGLAAAAWREVEMVPYGTSIQACAEPVDVTPEVAMATTRMHAALTDLMALLSACPRARPASRPSPLSGRGAAPSASVRPRAARRAGRAHAGRARDGPDRLPR